MAYQGIGTGTTPNDNSGDSLLTGAIKINSNFEELYNALGDGNTLTINTDKVTEGTNLYYTQARFDTAFSNKSTTNLPEGSNLYFTDERAQDAVGSAINAGIQTGISVTYDDSNNRINFNVAISSPFTTRGFSIPI